MASFSALTSYMPRLHKNYYLHSQLLIYYFFCMCLPAVEEKNAHEVLIKLVYEMCEADKICTISKMNKNHFA